MWTNNKIRFAISCRAILWDYYLSGSTVDWVSNFSVPNMNCCDACAVVYGKRLVKQIIYNDNLPQSYNRYQSNDSIPRDNWKINKRQQIKGANRKQQQHTTSSRQLSGQRAPGKGLVKIPWWSVQPFLHRSRVWLVILMIQILTVQILTVQVLMDHHWMWTNYLRPVQPVQCYYSLPPVLFRVFAHC